MFCEIANYDDLGAKICLTGIHSNYDQIDKWQCIPLGFFEMSSWIQNRIEDFGMTLGQALFGVKAAINLFPDVSAERFKAPFVLSS